MLVMNAELRCDGEGCEKEQKGVLTFRVHDSEVFLPRPWVGDRDKTYCGRECYEKARAKAVHGRASAYPSALTEPPMSLEQMLEAEGVRVPKVPTASLTIAEWGEEVAEIRAELCEGGHQLGHLIHTLTQANRREPTVEGLFQRLQAAAMGLVLAQTELEKLPFEESTVEEGRALVEVEQAKWAGHCRDLMLHFSRTYARVKLRLEAVGDQGSAEGFSLLVPVYGRLKEILQRLATVLLPQVTAAFEVLAAIPTPTNAPSLPDKSV